ncbi:hypothetical protein DPMN_023746 [Dreissena polymorpha]|uniref:Uncharacterized protein n=1 Tax=Dreissena polymorpha TaxID=45954 RepID=A0A9D4LNG9_DREPO|nr:hypothetical protein DPMN_023746 [Dreissena polymorpha]
MEDWLRFFGFSQICDSSEDEKSESPLLCSIPNSAHQAIMESDTLFAAASGKTTMSFLLVDEDPLLSICDPGSVLAKADSSIVSAAEEVVSTIAKELC